MVDLSIVEAAEASDDVALLRAMKMRVARAVQDDSTPPRDLAALTKRLKDITDELAALKAAKDEGVENGPVEDEGFSVETI